MTDRVVGWGAGFALTVVVVWTLFLLWFLLCAAMGVSPV